MYDVSFTAPRELTLKDLMGRGFAVKGSAASVRVDSTARVINPKGTWTIHHEDRPQPQASAQKVLEDVKAALRSWLESPGYEAEFTAPK